MNPFSRSEWSMHHAPTVTKENYGNQFESPVIEGLENPYEEYIGNGVNYSPYGLMGSTGPQGPQGPQGPASTVPGPAGRDGLNGSIGPTGPTGHKGDPGQAAAKGDTGPTGAPGKDGKDGSNGLIGPEGPRGLEGPRGEKGDKGDSLFGLPESWFEQKTRSGAFKNYPKCVTDGESKTMFQRYMLPGEPDPRYPNNTAYQLCNPYYNNGAAGWAASGGDAAARDNREDRKPIYKA
jgi:hypothetical protein